MVGDGEATGATASADAWEVEDQPRLPIEDGEPKLIVDVAGFEGPLDLLLALSRAQKVDLSRISILELADQYLQFIEAVRTRRLELAADYLVMAAWLAYLKSRLLLPVPPKDDEPTGEELAAELARRLRRLEAMREAAVALMGRNRLGRDVFRRGMPELMVVENRPIFQATLYELLTAYADHRQRRMLTSVRVERRLVWGLQEAREVLERLVGELDDWTSLDGFLATYIPAEERATVLASSFSASLEMVREGQLELRQSRAFGTLYLRRARGDSARGDGAAGTEDDGER